MINLQSVSGQQGLYEPSFEKSACGVGVVADITGARRHDIVVKALTVLKNLEHRSACGVDPETSDGAGILLGICDPFFRRTATEDRIELPSTYAVGMAFEPHSTSLRQSCRQSVEQSVVEVGLDFLGWREVPTDSSVLGRVATASQPLIAQFFVGGTAAGDKFERQLYVARKRIEKITAELVDAAKLPEQREIFYVCSLSSRTVVYKGMALPSRLGSFYTDMQSPDLASCFGLVHSRFSTNTLGSWGLAHPFRMLAHNGEINTVRGNRNWMKVHEQSLPAHFFGEFTGDIPPVCAEGGSDSAALDSAFELLRLGGRSIEHAATMLLPAAWYGNSHLSSSVRDFYEYHGTLTEPWDGPAMIAFSDGQRLGASLDRNGLRPFRYSISKDNLLVMGSETGVIPHNPSQIAKLDWVAPGHLFLVDFEEQRIVPYEELIERLASRQPYGQWLAQERALVSDLATPNSVPTTNFETLVERQVAFGYTEEDLKVVIKPMAIKGLQPVGSMGNDAPLAVMSEKPQLLPSYFSQLFAQVSNPPLDPIREKMVTQMAVPVGARGHLLSETSVHCRTLRIDHPVMLNDELARIKMGGHKAVKAYTISTLFAVADGIDGLKKTLIRICDEASKAFDRGYTLLILSDRGVDATHSYVPPLLATSAVHHDLIRQAKRLRGDILVESGEPREVHHFATLFGFGASAVNPYLAFETLDGLVKVPQNPAEPALPDGAELYEKYRQAAELGVLKTISKMGISTLQGYTGAQQFESLGLSEELIEKHFTWTPSRLGGIGLDELAQDLLLNHQRAFSRHDIPANLKLDLGGLYFWRGTGERHQWNPQTVALLQEAVTRNDTAKFNEFERLCDDPAGPTTVRSMLRLKYGHGDGVPLEEVEPAEKIVGRFATGAISLGSISREAHETLAVAMNRIGARSNSGEGGEDSTRFRPDAAGDLRNSAVKQVASGRFGVNTEYLVSARDIQIKMAQGAKPGEGGEIPGHKVSEYIARIRKTNPGIELISPPPHHDIYSIEDLAQLIHDLKNVNPRARISVKLVSEVGVGIIATGVAKGKGDVVLISGHSGGTGASPLSSIWHAGLPWELGLAETHQVLVANGLRDRIVVQVDGQMKTGRDMVVAALLGAEEWGVGTASLVTIGCIMLRKCHLNTCSVGVATQNPELRAKFTGTPEAVANYFNMLTASVRNHMAKLGFRTVDEMIGRADKLEQTPKPAHHKVAKLNFSRLLKYAKPLAGDHNHNCRQQNHGLAQALDNRLISLARPALKKGVPVEHELTIRNTNRSVGAMLSGQIARRYGDTGLPDGTIKFTFKGSAGLSFGAFLTRGVEFVLKGDANDYFGKGLSGGRIVAIPFENATIKADQSAIVGNVALYGATAGEVYISGKGGERFCVRNSAANAVIEGVGDHACEYMTGGKVVVLGRTGRNFGAGMSDGVAYVYDPRNEFEKKLAPTLVKLLRIEQDSAAEAELRQMIENHLRFTGSVRARQILATWDTSRTQFQMVVPRVRSKTDKVSDHEVATDRQSQPGVRV